jgi:DegV family protein with EDD domain
MAKIALVTDSTTNIPSALNKGFEVHVVPSVVIWGSETLRDGFDITPTEFYKRLASSKDMPTTSQPTPAAFAEKFEELKLKGYTDVLGVYVSAKFSGTLASAETAKQQVSGINIANIDGRSASMGTGWPLLEAGKAAKEGKSLADCVKVAEQTREHCGIMLLVDTLEFLHRGGRIGGGARFLGTALNLKPILEVQEGALEAVERVRTKGKAMDRMVDLLVERVGGRTPVHLAVLHANAEDEAKKLLEEGSKRVNPVETALADVSPAVGTHTGPGTLGFVYMAGVK